MSAVTLKEIAEWVGGHVIGDHSMLIRDALPLQDASLDCITLADNAKHADKIEQSPAAAAVVPQGFPVGGKALVVVDKPHLAFETIIQKLRPQTESHFEGVHPAAHIDPSAHIGSGL